MGALDVFVTPSERLEYFTGKGALKPRHKQLTFATGGIAVTFHQVGRVSFDGFKKYQENNNG